MSLLQVIFLRELYVLFVKVLFTQPVLFNRGQYLHLAFLQAFWLCDNGNDVSTGAALIVGSGSYLTLALQNLSFRFLFLLKPYMTLESDRKDVSSEVLRISQFFWIIPVKLGLGQERCYDMQMRLNLPVPDTPAAKLFQLAVFGPYFFKGFKATTGGSTHMF